MTDDDLTSLREQLDFQSGQIHGLRAVCAAIAHTKPLAESFRLEIQKAALAATSRSGATTVSDEYIHGLDEILQRFLAL